MNPFGTCHAAFSDLSACRSDLRGGSSATLRVWLSNGPVVSVIGMHAQEKQRARPRQTLQFVQPGELHVFPQVCKDGNRIDQIE